MSTVAVGPLVHRHCGNSPKLSKLTKKPLAFSPLTNQKRRTCMCSPMNHLGSFRCSYHKYSANQTASYPANSLNARRSAMTNSLVRIGTVEGLSSDSDSTSSNSSSQWDVFLSFRGPDTRLKFTNFLYNVLDLHGLRPFRDNPELDTGEVITDALKEAIRNSKTYVVVFSEDYASSPWCLDELVQIYKCIQEKKRWVIGVYYYIKPSDVRHQKGSFETSFKKLEEQGRYRDKIDQWRRALKGVAEFSGHTISQDSDGVDIINEIARVILQHVKPKTLHVADHFVARGILELIKNTITASLRSETVKGVIKIGLHGLGGVGKTTLAKALYNHLLDISDFNASCFLPDVREAFGRPNGLVSLQNQLISACTKSKTKDEVHSEDEGREFIKQRFGLTKVVLVIDDIDNTEQCNSLMAPFAPGSIVIITTRDTTTLDKIQVEHSHQFEVNVMNDAEALKLFTAHAFPNAEADKSLMALFGDDILSLAGNLPLALRVFGSHLFTKCKDGWEDYINKLKLNPNSTILDRLKISLDSMDDPILRNIFVDIACFFIGMRTNEVVDIMKKYYSLNVVHNIRTLEKRSLLTINPYERLGMHDLLRDMGREAARNKFPPDEPENHTRLWVLDDICDVLQQYRGEKAIEGIIPRNFYYGDALKKSEFTTDTFKNMSKLRFLYIQDVKLTGRFEHIFGSLKWLSWGSCPLTELPSHFRPRNLVALELCGSSIIKWDLKKDFEYLKTLDMSKSLDLTTLPDLSKLPKLETLNLEECESLEMFDIGDGCLKKLVTLNLHGCVNLRSICDRHCSLKALEVLVVSECEKLESLPDNLWEIASFRELCTGSMYDKYTFKSPFKEFILRNSALTTLPSSMSQLLNLENVEIHSSRNLVSLEHLPPTIKELSLHHCDALKKLPDLSNFTKLQKIYMFSCKSLTEIVGLEGLTSLKELDCMSRLLNLENVEIYSSPNLVSLEHLPPTIKELFLYDCEALKKLPDLSNFIKLQKIKMVSCKSLTEIVGLEGLTSLKELDCNSSLLGYTFVTRLFKIPSQNVITIYLWGGDIPDWIRSRDNIVDTYSNKYTFIAPDVQQRNFLGIMLCFKFRGPDKYNSFGLIQYGLIPYEVHNSTTNESYREESLEYRNQCVMIILPSSVISVTGGDKIVVSLCGFLIGFQLIYDD